VERSAEAVDESTVEERRAAVTNLISSYLEHDRHGVTREV
jgi:hypothetical protein